MWVAAAAAAAMLAGPAGLALTPDEEIVKAKEEWQAAASRGDRAAMRAAAERARRARAAGGTIPATATLEEARRLLPPRLAEHRLSGDGVELYLREKRPGWQERCSGRAVLFLEPFGVPSAMAFDVPGFSWMDYVARRGFTAYALDVRGFGRSTRPAGMSQPPAANPPLVRAAEVLPDVDAAVDFIRRACGAEKVDIIGWSWGAVVGGMYAAENPGKVDRLVLYGAMHGFDLPWMAKLFEDPAKPGQIKNLPAYQVVGPPALIGHWDKMINDMVGPGKADARSPEALAAVTKVFLASDPSSPKEGQIRRPMGPLVDLYYIWTSRPIYDASKIQAPTLLIRGDRDEFADPTFIDRLTGAAWRREVVIGDATHWVIYEKNRDQLLREVQAFLEEGRDLAGARRGTDQRAGGTGSAGGQTGSEGSGATGQSGGQTGGHEHHH